MRRIGWVLILLVLLIWYIVFGSAAFYWPQTNITAYIFWAYVGCLLAFFFLGWAIFLVLGMSLTVGHYYFDRLYLGDGLGAHEQWVPFMHIAIVALAGIAVYLRRTEQPMVRN